MHDDDIRTSDPTTPYVPAARPLGVIVGYDGSDQANQALHYGARAAQGLGARLTVVAAYTVPSMIYVNMASMPAVPEDVAALDAAKQLLAEAREQLAGYPGEVELHAEKGDAAGVLVHLSSRAELAVVGARGRGGFVGRLLGSVSSALPAHAHCPTVVVPRQYEEGTGEGADRYAPFQGDAPIVAGVDHSDHIHAAARLAAQAAHNRSAPLLLVTTMQPPEDWGSWYTAMAPDQSVLEQHRERLLADLENFAEDSLRPAFPELTVTCEVELADPTTQLVDHSSRAQLTVVGTRGHGRIASVLLGSVSRTLLQRAEGPVMVVPPLSHGSGEHDPSRPR